MADSRAVPFRPKAYRSEPNRPEAYRADPSSARLPWTGLAALAVVYLVWGSTYLAIRIAVRDGSGFPPFAMAAMRALLAGSVLLGASRLLGHRLRLSRRELGLLVASGLLMWLGGNGLVVWAEQHADSGYAAVVVGSTPIWVATINALLDRRAPSPLLLVALALGLTGVAVLSGLLVLPGEPWRALGGLDGGARRVASAEVDVLALAALLGASVTWSLGTVLQRRQPVDVSPQVSSAYQLLFGGIAFLVLTLARREPVPHPTPEAWLAWLYLVVFGSLLAFTAFISMLRLLPPNVAMTYSYVNPVVAVFLGWLVLAEPLTAWTLVGVGLVLVGVAGVYRSRR